MPTANRSFSRRSAGRERRTVEEREDAPAGMLAPLIDRLTAIGATEHWVVSCYLKLEPRDRGRAKYQIKIKNRIKNLLEGLEARGLTRAERAVVERDVHRVREHLAHPTNLPAGRGIAIFACEPLELFEAVPLPVVFRSRFVVDHSPLVRELAALESEFGRVLCVAYDRTSARFFAVTPAAVDELPSLTADDTTRTGRFHGPRAERGVRASSPGEHNFNQRIREEKQRHYAQIAQRLFAAMREAPVRGIVLAGTGADVAAVQAHLHPYVAEAVLGTTKLNPKTVTPADVLDAVLEVRRERERDWERRHVAELAEGLGTGWALTGVTATLEALNRGQVRTLLVDSSTERSGFRCAASGRLSITANGCNADGPPQPVPDVIDEAIEEALRQGCHVDVVEDPEARTHVDGLASLLRFKIG